MHQRQFLVCATSVIWTVPWMIHFTRSGIRCRHVSLENRSSLRPKINARAPQLHICFHISKPLTTFPNFTFPLPQFFLLSNHPQNLMEPTTSENTSQDSVNISDSSDTLRNTSVPLHYNYIYSEWMIPLECIRPCLDDNPCITNGHIICDISFGRNMHLALQVLSLTELCRHSRSMSFLKSIIICILHGTRPFLEWIVADWVAGTIKG